MKGRLLKFLKWFGIVLLVANVGILVSGRSYLYKGIANTYLKGRSGPSILEHEIFANVAVHASQPQPWPQHSNYNLHSLPEGTLKTLEAHKIVSFLVIHRDSILFEKYWDPVGPATATNSFSVAKSIVAVLAGVAIQEGKITSLDQAVGDFLPSFTSDGKEKITIRHLLTMSSGLNWTESGGNPFSDNAEGYYGTDLQGQIEELESISEPGKEFIYLSGNSQILAFVVEAATGKSVSEYAAEKLWGPIGAERDALWNLDKEGGTEKAFCCFYATARDFARVGKLFLHNGEWNGQQLVPADFVALSTSPASTTDHGKPNQRYGYHWWTETYNGFDIAYARGILGQYIITIPAHDLVIFRAGHARAGKNDRGHPTDLYGYVDAALNLIAE